MSDRMNQTVVIETSDQFVRYQAVLLKHGLRMYGVHRIKPNSQWTPTKMLQAAGKIIGKVYKRGQYLQAAEDLHQWLEDPKN